MTAEENFDDFNDDEINKDDKEKNNNNNDKGKNKKKEESKYIKSIQKIKEKKRYNCMSRKYKYKQ